MAQDCYKTIFKTVYNQAIADGLTATVATAAAQSAMQDCLNRQAVQVAPTQTMTVIPNSRVTDPGPVDGGPITGNSRGGNLGRV